MHNSKIWRKQIKRITFTKHETSYERRRNTENTTRKIGEKVRLDTSTATSNNSRRANTYERGNDVQTDARAAAMDSRVSQGTEAVLRPEDTGTDGMGRTDTSGVLGSGLESEQSDTGRRSGSGNDVAELMDGNNMLAQRKEFFETLFVGKICLQLEQM